MKNMLKAKLQRGEQVVGILTGLGHPDVTELLSRAGYDFIYIDDEHGPMNYETIQRMMQVKS